MEKKRKKKIKNRKNVNIKTDSVHKLGALINKKNNNRRRVTIGLIYQT